MDAPRAVACQSALEGRRALMPVISSPHSPPPIRHSRGLASDLHARPTRKHLTPARCSQSLHPSLLR
jgi:hypothetical protein